MKRTIDAGMWRVFQSGRIKGAHHPFETARNSLENILTFVLTKSHPDVPAPSATGLLPGAAHQLGVQSKLDELSPCPHSVVLAIALAQSLKGARMLPEVGLVEKLRIVNVPALHQPRAHVGNVLHLDRALAFEIPGEGMDRTASKHAGPRTVRQSLPRVISLGGPSRPPAEWRERPLGKSPRERHPTSGPARARAACESREAARHPACAPRVIRLARSRAPDREAAPAASPRVRAP